MANKRKFNESVVLEHILHLFWQKGYEATSLDDITKVTGVKRQSLYNVFGNKENMLNACYTHYIQKIDNILAHAATISQGKPIETCRFIFKAFIELMTDTNSPAGCFIVNAAMEFGEHQQAQITNYIHEHFAHMEQYFYELFAKNQRDNMLAKECDPRSMAQFILAGITSMAVMYKLNKDSCYIQNIADEILNYIIWRTRSDSNARPFDS